MTTLSLPLEFASSICVRKSGGHEIHGHVVMITFYVLIKKTDVISGPSVKTQQGYLAIGILADKR